jgi:hypothetical protein
MNEKLKELAEQAGWSEHIRYKPTRLEIEKFAELIIKECIDVHEADYGIDIIGDLLKKHFGVKE